jgi:hypothetical protein
MFWGYTPYILALEVVAEIFGAFFVCFTWRIALESPGYFSRD